MVLVCRLGESCNYLLSLVLVRRRGRWRYAMGL